MEALKKLGLTEEQIKKLQEGTEEQQLEIIDSVKKNIENNIVNNPDRYKEIVDKTKLETTKIIEKKIAKTLGVQIDSKDDNLDTILEKGRRSLISNSELTAQELQSKVVELNSKIQEYDTAIIPSVRIEEQAKLSQVYIDMALNSSASKFEKSILPIEDRILIGRNKIESSGYKFDYDTEKKSVIVKHKETGLKPQFGDKTFELTDLDGVLGAVLEPYIHKSNGGTQPTTAPSGGSAIVTSVELNETAQRLLNEYTKK